jgi:two-component system, OmpR family, aerobic respiration control sensor histidine kinase ArcB
MVLIVAIIGMIIIMVRERNRVLVIETEAQTIHRVQYIKLHKCIQTFVDLTI